MNRLELGSVQISSSQFGEHVAIRLFAERLGLLKGVYVDQGASHHVFGLQ
jgi:hypothetical protein